MITVVRLDRDRDDWARLYAAQHAVESGATIDPASVLATPRPRWSAFTGDSAPGGVLVGVAQTNPDRDASPTPRRAATSTPADGSNPF